MGKPNAYLQRIAIKLEAEKKIARLFCIQQTRDIAAIALNKAFGFGAKRLKKFLEEYDRVILENAEMVMNDVKSDKEIEYSKAKLDGALKPILGEYFVPWEERYLLAINENEKHGKETKK